MIEVLFGTFLFGIGLYLGNVLSFLPVQTYWLMVPFILYLVLTKHMYACTCKTIERKDFILSACFTIGSCLLLQYLGVKIISLIIVYLYLIVFLSYVGYASSIRFKTLTH